MRWGKIGYFAAMVLAGFATATVNAAVIQRSTTHAGHHMLTGGRGQINSYGAARLLIDHNNHLYAHVGKRRRPSFMDDYLGLSPDDGEAPLGLLLAGPRGTLVTYDRLARQRVMQVFGYDPTGSGNGLVSQLSALPAIRRVNIRTGGAIMVSPAPPRSGASTLVDFLPLPPTPPLEDLPTFPEPSSIFLLAGGGLVLLSRRAGKRRCAG